MIFNIKTALIILEVGCSEKEACETTDEEAKAGNVKPLKNLLQCEKVLTLLTK